MLKIKKFIVRNIPSAIVLVLLLMPAATYGAGLVPCGGPGEPRCDWNQLMDMINRLIQFILFDLALPIAAIMFAYTGIRMIFAGGGEARAKWKEVLLDITLGLLFVAGAWLIVRTILEILNFEGSWIGF